LKVRPSPKPEALQEVLEKNSMRKVLFGVLFRVPNTVVFPPLWSTDVRTG